MNSIPKRSADDISQQLAELERQRAEADALFLSLGDGAIATNEECTICRVNHVALDILGVNEEEILGKWYPKTIVAIDETGKPIPALDRPITRAFITGKPVSEQVYYRTKSNPKLPVFITVSPTMLKGRPIGAIAIFRDISKEHEIDRMKSEFISIASHQLRTPLSAINTYTQMLLGGYAGDLSAEQKNFTRIILSSIDRMNELISALLDISRIESGMLRINPLTIDYREVVWSIIDELEAYARDKNVKVMFRAPTESLNVMADPLLLKEVCANLLSNAIKYTPPGGKVTVSLKTKDNDAILSVKDTGYGIPQENQHSVFTKFFRAGNIMQKETYGTGLGLYMVKLIANSVDGKVWFKSRENVGSIFYFSVPIKSVDSKLSSL